jgi:Ni,Fe-hydrogenase III large subunit
MNLRETWFDATELRERTLETCATHQILGAFASDGRKIRYLFADAEGPFALCTALPDGARLESLAPDHPAFDWDEREMRDEWNVDVRGLPDARPLMGSDGRIPEAIVAEGEGVTRIVVGPVHAGIIEPGRFTISSGGETIVHLDAQLGYARRGVERFMRGRSISDASHRVARICGSCSAARSFAFARAVEAIAGVEISRPVEYARVVIAELERIYNHLGDLAAASAGAGWGKGFASGMAAKERAMRTNARASGHRLLFDAIRPGGVGHEVLADRAGLSADVGHLEAHADAFVEMLFSNRSVMDRWRGAGHVSKSLATAFAASGPAGRASGAGIDMRRLAPYGAYRELAVSDVTAARIGDSFARCTHKRVELFESFQLVREALARLGDDALTPATLPPIGSGIAACAVEGPRGAETVAVELDDAGDIVWFHAISASYRNWPIVARAMDGNIVPDFPLVNKSFNLCYACADR